MRLIDSNSLVMELRKQANSASLIYKANEQCGNDENMNFYLGKWEGYENCAYHVENTCPAIDAEPVRHGNWLPVDKREPRDLYQGVCSLCGCQPLRRVMSHTPYDYCPNCGARMVTDDV